MVLEYNKSTSIKTKKHSLQKIISLLLVIFCSGLISSFVAPVSNVSASSAPTQFSIPNTSLTLKGYASPNAFVQIFDGSALIGTTTANSSGVFEKRFPSMNSGLKNIKLQYDDIDSNSSDTLSQTINIRPQAETAIEFFLPPTLELSTDRITEGDRITFSGSTIPNATVEIILDGGNLILRPQSGSDGRYSIAIDTTDYYFGNHTIRATTLQGTLKSYQTNNVLFLVTPAGQDEQNTQPDAELKPPIINVTDGKLEANQQSQLIRGNAAPNTQIIIYQDGEPVGSTFSNEEGDWFYNITVSERQHIIRSVSCSAFECSEFSNEVTVTFTGNFNTCTNFKIFVAEYRFWGVTKNDGINLPVSGISGEPSYEILVDWGDSVTERFNRNSAAGFDLHHVYNEIGQFNGSITAVDETGCEHTRYFSVDVIEDTALLSGWMLLATPVGLLLAYLQLRHRFTVRRKQLRLAR